MIAALSIDRGGAEHPLRFMQFIEHGDDRRVVPFDSNSRFCLNQAVVWARKSQCITHQGRDGKVDVRLMAVPKKYDLDLCHAKGEAKRHRAAGRSGYPPCLADPAPIILKATLHSRADSRASSAAKSELSSLSEIFSSQARVGRTNGASRKERVTVRRNLSGKTEQVQE